METSKRKGRNLGEILRHHKREGERRLNFEVEKQLASYQLEILNSDIGFHR